MSAYHSQGKTVKKMIDPASCANTAAATSTYISMANAEGDLELTVSAGAITGSMTPTFEHASDTGGTGSVAIVPNEGAIGAMTANTVVRRTIRKDHIQGFMRVVGTIVTGPTLFAVSVAYTQKNA